MGMLVSAGGAGRTSSRMAAQYNFLQRAVEEGKSRLKMSMDNTDPPHRYLDKSGVTDATTISAADTLLLSDESAVGLGHVISRDLGRGELRSQGIAGEGGSLVVKIYDMQYSPDKVDSAMPDEELGQLPPSMTLTGAGDWTDSSVTTLNPDYEKETGHGSGADNIGVYLVRATLKVRGSGGDSGGVWTLDSAIMQSNNK
jgi:hypothetical protein